MIFHANWLTPKGEIARRDVHNYASVLADVFCAITGVDDSCFWSLELHKHHYPHGEERVQIEVYLASAK